MAILPLLTLPNSILKQKSLPVESVSKKTRKIMDDLLETMYADKGVGLAAVQVGILERILVIDLQEDDDVKRTNGFYPLFVANPEIVEKSNDLKVATEGCLSIPGQKIEVARPSDIKVRFLDYKNNQQQIVAQGWLARAMQHEIDHLNGKLVIDYLTPIKRDVTMRKLIKINKNH